MEYGRRGPFAGDFIFVSAKNTDASRLCAHNMGTRSSACFLVRCTCRWWTYPARGEMEGETGALGFILVTAIPFQTACPPYDKYRRHFAKLQSVVKFCTLKQKNGIKARDLLSNPIYCKADEISFDYFYQKNRNICSDEKDFDAFHGIMAYNIALTKKGWRRKKAYLLNRTLFGYVRTSQVLNAAVRKYGGKKNAASNVLTSTKRK